MLWLLAPLVFFTFAGNILPAYVLPAVPAFALLLGHWAASRTVSVAYVALIVPGLIAIASVTGFFASTAHRSQKDLVAYHYSSTPSETLYYYPSLPRSASFYSNGRAQALVTDAELARFLLEDEDGFVAVRSKDANKLAPDVAPCMIMQAVVHDYALFFPTVDCAGAKELAMPSNE